MVTVKDLVEKLKEYPEDMPVYWGWYGRFIGEFSHNRTIQDFPMQERQEENYYVGSTYHIGVPCLYFSDFKDTENIQNRYDDLRCKLKEVHGIRDFLKLWKNRWQL